MMIKKSRAFLCLAVSVFAVLYAPTAIASEIIYSTFGAGQSYNTTMGLPIGTLPFSFDETQEMEAAIAFTPFWGFAVDSIDIAVLLDSFSVSNHFSVSLARDSGSNLPGTILETFSFVGIADMPAVYSSSSLLHPQLSAGEKYWMVMSSDNLLNIYLTWLEASPYLADEIAYKNGLFADWVCTYGAAPAIEVHGSAAVSEPFSIFLLGLGLTALAAEKRKTDG